MLTPAPQPAPLKVHYDGACPLCRREMALYQGLSARQPVCFVDVSQANAALPAHLTQAQLLARLHVQDSNGQWHSGAQAFLRLWAVLPGWRWLARLGRLPGAAWVMEMSYRLFLRLRPALQRLARRLEKPSQSF